MHGMFSRKYTFGAFLVMLCLLAAQVHVFADLDPCLLNGNSSHNNSSHNHRCQGCESGTVVLAGSLPSLSPFANCADLAHEGIQHFVSRPRAEGRAPRAPPA